MRVLVVTLSVCRSYTLCAETENNNANVITLEFNNLTLAKVTRANRAFTENGEISGVYRQDK